MRYRVKKTKDWFSILSVGFLIAVTANPYFYENIFPMILGIFYYGYLFYKNGLKLQKSFIQVLIFIAIVFIGRYFTAGTFGFLTFLGVEMRFLLTYFILRLLRQDFFKSFVSFVYFFAIVSLIIYIPANLNHGIIDFLVNNVTPYLHPPFSSYTDVRQQIVIYDFSNFYRFRLLNFGLNSGFYWEPGAHAIFLNLALLLNIYFEKKLLSIKNIIFIFTILTTFSTTGYIAMFLNVGIYFINIFRNKYFGIIMLLVAFAIFYTMFSSLGFMKEKIDFDIKVTKNEKMIGSRFQSLYFDLKTFIDYPLFGYDQYYGVHEFRQQLHRNNGIGILLATYGVFAFSLYMAGVYLGIRNFARQYSIGNNFVLSFYILFIILNFGMPLLLRPIMYAFALLPMIYHRKYYPLLVAKTHYIDNTNS